MATQPLKIDPFARQSAPGYTRWNVAYDEWRRQLLGTQGIKTRREMARSPYGAAIMRASTLVYRRLAWRVDPASEAQADQDAAAWLDTAKDDMSQPWINFISQCVANMFEQGYAVFEHVYKQRDGEKDSEQDIQNDVPSSKYDDAKIGWRGFYFIPPETIVDEWDIPDGQGWQGVTQNKPTGGREYLPKQKLLLFRLDDRTGSPVGSGGVFDDLYRSWHFLTELQKVDAITKERFGGIPIVTLLNGAAMGPDDPTSDEYNARKVVERFVVNEQAGFVETETVKWRIESPGTGTTNMAETIDSHKRDFFMGALAQWAMLGATATGSFALSTDQTDFFVMALEGWLGSIVQVLNDVAIPRLFKLNPFPGMTAYPKLAHGPITRRDGKLFAETLAQLATGMWVTPTPEDEEFLRHEYDLPERKAEDIEAEREAAKAEEEARLLAEAEAKANQQLAPEDGDTPPLQASELARTRRELYNTRITLAQYLDRQELKAYHETTQP